MKVLLDTNALMMPFQFRVDLFEELRSLVGVFEPVVLCEVLVELQKLARGHGRDAAAARSALTLGERCMRSGGDEDGRTVDKKIIDYAVKEGCIVVTNDRALRNSLLVNHITVISLRNRNRLTILRG
ncbi:MAG: nucleotide-binding protein [Methanoregulaceae archaeon]|nr:nucleotide-binding protein [Methanoregulaceae archaeon]